MERILSLNTQVDKNDVSKEASITITDKKGRISSFKLLVHAFIDE